LRQQHWRVEEVLHAVQDQRLVRPVAERNDRLEAEEIVAAHRCQPVEPAGQHPPRDRPLAGDAKGSDAVVVPVGVGLFLVVMVLMADGKGFVAQPALHVDTLGRGVEEAEVEQLGRISGALGDRDERGARIERLEPGLERPPKGGLCEIVSGRRSATAACFTASGWRSSVAAPLTRSTVVTTPSSM
jgi:hypothetical protein